MTAEDMVAEQVHAELARLRSALDRAEADRATLAIELERLNAGLEGYSIVYGQNAVMCDACTAVTAVIAGCGPSGKPSDLKGVVLAAIEHSRECTAADREPGALVEDEDGAPLPDHLQPPDAQIPPAADPTAPVVQCERGYRHAAHAVQRTTDGEPVSACPGLTDLEPDPDDVPWRVTLRRPGLVPLERTDVLLAVSLDQATERALLLRKPGEIVGNVEQADPEKPFTGRGTYCPGCGVPTNAMHVPGCQRRREGPVSSG